MESLIPSVVIVEELLTWRDSRADVGCAWC